MASTAERRAGRHRWSSPSTGRSTHSTDSSPTTSTSCVLDGEVSSELVGGRRHIEDGRAALVPTDEQPAVFELIYALRVLRPDGRRFELVGVKTVRDDRGVDLWRDTSTRRSATSRLRPPGLERRPRTTSIARGRLRISVLGFLVLFLRCAPPDDGRCGRRPSPPDRTSRDAARPVRRRGSSGEFARIYGNPFVGQLGGDPGDRRRSAGTSEARVHARSRVQWTNPRTIWRTFAPAASFASTRWSIDVRRRSPASPEVWSDLAQGGEVWLDFIADTGDGFAATYTVAYTASPPELEIAGQVAPTRPGTRARRRSRLPDSDP